MYSIGEIISTYRKKKGLLQQDLADELAKEGITISYKAISNWERNLAEPSVTIFYKVCRILGITNMYEAYFGVNPADPFSSLTDEGREKAMDYINLLHASGMYEKQTAKIIPFRSIDIFENAVSAGTGNFLVDGPKETVRIDESIQRRKVKDFFIKFKKKSHFADFLTEQTLDFVLHRLFCGLAEMDTDDIGCLADLLSDSRARGAVGCGIVHSKSSCK